MSILTNINNKLEQLCSNSISLKDKQKNCFFPCNVVLHQEEKRFWYNCNVSICASEANKTLGNILFSFPKSSNGPVSVEHLNNFYPEDYDQVGTYLIYLAAKCSDLYADGSMILDALSDAVGFYAKLGFEINWDQYENDDGNVPVKLRDKLLHLFEILKAKRLHDPSKGLYLKLLDKSSLYQRVENQVLSSS